MWGPGEGPWHARELKMTSELEDTPFIIDDREFRTRLIVGTGKYKDNDTMVAAIRASGAEMVTVAVRRIDLDRTKEEGILYHLDPDEFLLLPNTAGCYSVEDALRSSRLARAAGRVGRSRGARGGTDRSRRHRGHAEGQVDE